LAKLKTTQERIKSGKSRRTEEDKREINANIYLGANIYIYIYIYIYIVNDKYYNRRESLEENKTSQIHQQ
jgi:hypothetical protein